MKKIILGLIVIIIFSTITQAETIGDTSTYTDSYLNIENYIYGIAGGPTTTDGTAKYIKAKIVTNPDYTGSVSCALYEYVASNNAGSLIGQTEEKTITGSQDSWFQFNFSSPPPIADNTNYFICISAEAQAGTCLIEYNVDFGSEGIYKTNTYEYPWDDPLLSESDVSYTLSLYCYYEANASPVPSTDNISVTAINPINNSHISSAPLLFFNITNVTSDYNYYVYVGETSSTTTALLYSSTLNDNDTFYAGNYSNASVVGTRYYWRVQVNNSTIGFNYTFNFLITSSNKGMIISNPGFEIACFILSATIIAILLYRKKRLC